MSKVKEREIKERYQNPTPKQRMVIAGLLNNVRKPRPASHILAEAGYKKIANQPSRILQSQGIRNGLAEFGLTEELITCALVDDIAKKPQRRVAELTLGSDLLGMRTKAEDNDKTPRVVIINEVRVEEKKPAFEPINGDIEV